MVQNLGKGKKKNTIGAWDIQAHAFVKTGVHFTILHQKYW